MNEIRQLVENYYDIQKIRVETFNRIVMFVKENESKFKEILSHADFETQVNNASQFVNETHVNDASQGGFETHEAVASHNSSETQVGCASHGNCETHKNDASQHEVETHSETASHERGETHFAHALKLLENKKFAEFVKKYVIISSQKPIETHTVSASHGISETQSVRASQVKIETHSFPALSPLIKQIENLIWFHNKLYETEKELYKRLDAWSRKHSLRTEYLNHVKGIGPVLASGIIAWLEEPIKKANHVSQIWSYCGLAPGQERKRGEKTNYNPKLKTFAWKIGESFIKFKCFGRKLYDSFKEQAKQKHPDWTKLHIHNYARRKVVKLFIASVWEVWRKMNNLPTTKPYPIDFLGHKEIITPEMWMEKKGDV